MLLTLSSIRVTTILKMSLVDVGKSEYKTIANLRDNLEKDLVIDLQSLYKIEIFLSNKTVVTGYEERNISDKPKS